LFPANRGGGTPWQSMPTVIPSEQPKYSFTHCYFMRPLKKIPNLQLGGAFFFENLEIFKVLSHVMTRITA
jgi:hypothetical protein